MSPTANYSSSVIYNVCLNHKTTLHTLCHYILGAIVEYPETSTEGAIGHLFEVA
jgi:hypothetical protein